MCLLCAPRRPPTCKKTTKVRHIQTKRMIPPPLGSRGHWGGHKKGVQGSYREGSPQLPGEARGEKEFKQASSQNKKVLKGSLVWSLYSRPFSTWFPFVMPFFFFFFSLLMDGVIGAGCCPVSIACVSSPCYRCLLPARFFFPHPKRPAPLPPAIHGIDLPTNSFSVRPALPLFSLSRPLPPAKESQKKGVLSPRARLLLHR